MKKITKILILLIVALSGLGISAQAQTLNDKIMNRPYADLRRWHLGFSVGLHTQDLSFVHNGYTTPEGENWWMEQPAFQPGFNVSALIDLRLNDYFNVRFSPGIMFGTRDVRMKEEHSEEVLKQSVKSTYLAFPVDLKYSALRYRNARPYLIGGIMPIMNLTRKAGDYLQLKPIDFMLTIGFGCDFYLPYFKFIPEVKFCFGLTDVINHDRPDLEDDPGRLKITQSLKKATSSMVVFTFYFE